MRLWSSRHPRRIRSKTRRGTHVKEAVSAFKFADTETVAVPNRLPKSTQRSSGHSLSVVSAKLKAGSKKSDGERIVATAKRKTRRSTSGRHFDESTGNEFCRHSAECSIGSDTLEWRRGVAPRCRAAGSDAVRQGDVGATERYATLRRGEYAPARRRERHGTPR